MQTGNQCTEIQELSGYIKSRNRQQISLVKSLDINPVKLELINAYQYGYRGQIKYTNEKASGKEKCGIIVGYRLKNVDNKQLHYVKCRYTQAGIETYKETVSPGDEFIITRDEVKYLMVQNGSKLSNANIKIRTGNADRAAIIFEAAGRTDRIEMPKWGKGVVTARFYMDHVFKHGAIIGSEFIQRDGLPYIQFKRNSGKSIRQKEYCISITKTSENDIKLIDSPEIKKAFYWVEDGYITHRYSKDLRVLPMNKIMDIAVNRKNYQIIEYNNGKNKIYLDGGFAGYSDVQAEFYQHAIMEIIAISVLNIYRAEGAVDNNRGLTMSQVRRAVSQALYADSNKWAGKLWASTLINRSLSNYSDLATLMNDNRKNEKLAQVLGLSYDGRIKYETFKIASSLTVVEMAKRNNAYKLAGYDCRQNGHDIGYNISCKSYRRESKDTVSLSILTNEDIKVTQIQTLLDRCEHVEILDLSETTVLLNSVKGQFGRRQKESIDKLYIEKICLPGGILMYTTGEVRYPNELIKGLIFNDEQLADQVGMKCDSVEFQECAISSILEPIQQTLNTGRYGISKQQCDVIINMIRSGIFEKNIVKLMTQVGIIREEDLDILNTTGLIHLVEECAYCVYLYITSRMFDDMGINTKIITSNSYVKMAAERHKLRNRLN